MNNWELLDYIEQKTGKRPLQQQIKRHLKTGMLVGTKNANGYNWCYSTEQADAFIRYLDSRYFTEAAKEMTNLFGWKVTTRHIKKLYDDGKIECIGHKFMRIPKDALPTLKEQLILLRKGEMK